MAQKQEDVDSSSQTLDHSQSSSSSCSDPLLSRNASFSKLNAKAPEFVPTRPQQPPPAPPPSRLTVVPSPSPPAVMHIYPPPPLSPFHVPIHSPVSVPHVIPVQNHHLHHNHRHQQHHNHQHQHHHHNQQYVPVRNHNSHHQGQNSHYVPVQYHGNQQHQNHYGPGSKKGQSEDELEGPAKKNVTASDHKSKSDQNGLSDEAMQKLLNQVEYYFSDLNLATTDHLMRFINKDPEGYVPISVVASFKKIKVAIHSNFQLASILQNSSKLVVSEDGKKVRRQHPLTESDVEELQTRIVVAENLPEVHCHQNLMKIFSTVGSVKTIRTCPPQNSGGGASSASRSTKVDGMHYSNKLHAFVEYESIDIAEKSVAELNDKENWSGLKLRLMLRSMSKRTEGQGKKGNDGLGQSEEEEVSTSEQQPNEKQNDDSSHQYDNHSQEHYRGDQTNNDKEGAQRKGRHRGQGKGRGRGQYHHNHHNNRGNHVVNTPSNNPIIGEQQSMAKQPPGPRMPDGTRGFAIGRGKPVAVSIT